MAAQPMVRRSLSDPLLTYEVNVMGTVNVLDAVRSDGARCAGRRVVTSDKCYENPPGGATALHRERPPRRRRPLLQLEGLRRAPDGRLSHSFFSPPSGPAVASARAGNVIGGGDWGEDRLLAGCHARVRVGEALEGEKPAGRAPLAARTQPARGLPAARRAPVRRARARTGMELRARRRGRAQRRLGRRAARAAVGRGTQLGAGRRAPTRPRRRTWRSTRGCRTRARLAPGVGSRAGARAHGRMASGVRWRRGHAAGHDRADRGPRRGSASR